MSDYISCFWTDWENKGAFMKRSIETCRGQLLKYVYILLALAFMHILTSCEFEDNEGKYWSENWIATMNIDGSEVEYLYYGRADLLYNGEYIIFSTRDSIMTIDRDGTEVVINRDGFDVKQVTEDKIVLYGASDIHLMDIDGSNLTNMTNHLNCFAGHSFLSENYLIYASGCGDYVEGFEYSLELIDMKNNETTSLGISSSDPFSDLILVEDEVLVSNSGYLKSIDISTKDIEVLCDDRMVSPKYDEANLTVIYYDSHYGRIRSFNTETREFNTIYNFNPGVNYSKKSTTSDFEYIALSGAYEQDTVINLRTGQRHSLEVYSEGAEFIEDYRIISTVLRKFPEED